MLDGEPNFGGATGPEGQAALDDGWNDSDGQWAPLVQDGGDRIKLDGTSSDPDIFEGVFTDIEEVELDQEDGTRTMAKLLFFARRSDGARCNMWANYALNKALEAGLTPGQKVRITHRGKAPTNKPGQSVNRLTVEVAG